MWQKITVLLILLLPLNLFLKIPMENAKYVKNQIKSVNVANNDNVARFLHYISQLETSGGTNLDHKPVEHGLQAGDVAEGQYGVMPNTMDELNRRYPSSFNEESSPDDYANVLANKVLNRSGGDETLAAGLWNQGHNTKPEDFDKVRNSDYAQKYDQMRQEIPYSLDANPYQKEYADKQQDFLNLKQLLKK